MNPNCNANTAEDELCPKCGEKLWQYPNECVCVSTAKCEPCKHVWDVPRVVCVKCRVVYDERLQQEDK